MRFRPSGGKLIGFSDQISGFTSAALALLGSAACNEFGIGSAFGATALRSCRRPGFYYDPPLAHPMYALFL